MPVLAVAIPMVILLVVVLLRRADRNRAKLQRRDLDDLRRIYRRDNPRGTGLDPVIRDQQRAGVYPWPKDGR